MLFHWACKSTKLELNEGASYCLGRLQKPRSAGPAALTVAAVVAAAAGHGAARRDGAGAAHGVGRGARCRPRRTAAAHTPRKRRATVCILRCVFVANHKAQLDHSSELTLVRNGLVQ